GPRRADAARAGPPAAPWPRDRARDRGVRPRARPPPEGYPAIGGPKRGALLADPRPLAAARRLDVAHLRGPHAAGRGGPPPASTGADRRRPDPGHPDRGLRQPGARRGHRAVAREAHLGAPPPAPPPGARPPPRPGADPPRVGRA